MLLLALFGLLLLRLATRQLLALLSQLPPRLTRFEPYGQYPRKIGDLRLLISDCSFPSVHDQAARLSRATIRWRNPSVSAKRA